jgi:hypothetical protein
MYIDALECSGELEYGGRVGVHLLYIYIYIFMQGCSIAVIQVLEDLSPTWKK